MKENNINNIIPIITYNNALKDKSLIYKDNKNKSGVYRWNNIITGKSYIGSSINLTRRLSIYYSKNAMINKLSNRKSIIYSALLKHYYNNFSLDILEYCKIDLLVEKEQYYINQLKPEYNILKAANSRIGSKHSLETRALMSIKQKGINHNFFGKSHSHETRVKISESLKSSLMFSNSVKLRPAFRTNETKLNLSLRSHGVGVIILDKSNNVINKFPTTISTAKHFKISVRTVGRYLDKNILYNNYIF